MTAENVAITVPLVIGSGETATTLGDICNTIMPGLLPLAFTLLMYWLVSKKNVKTTTLLVALVVIACRLLLRHPRRVGRAVDTSQFVASAHACVDYAHGVTGALFA